MVGSFSWGLIRLTQTLWIDDRGSSDWSFGQVVPIVLLAAPLLTIFESFFQGTSFPLWRKEIVLISLAEKPKNTLSTALVQIHTAYSQFDHGNPSANKPLQERDHPDYDFYRNSYWTISLIYVMVAYAIGLMMEVLILSGSGSVKLVVLLIPTPLFVTYLPVYTTLTIWLFTIISMLLEDIGCAQTNASRSILGMQQNKVIETCNALLCIFSVSGIFIRYTTGDVVPLFFLASSVAVYCTLSVLVHFTTVRHGDVFV